MKVKYRVKTVFRKDCSLDAAIKLEILTGVQARDGKLYTVRDLPEILVRLIPEHADHRWAMGRKIPRVTGRGTIFRSSELINIFRTGYGPEFWSTFDNLVGYRVWWERDGDDESEVQ